MNYQYHYNLLCERAQNRQLDCYTEKHRIVPGCMGGEYTPDNVVYLTAEEHYVAHQLLVKMYPNHQGLIHAAKMMTINPNGNDQRNNNKLYGWLKRQHSKQMKEYWQNPDFRKQTIKRMKEYWQNPEYREQMSRQTKELWQNPEYREKLTNIGKELWNNEEYRIKQSTAHSISLQKPEEKIRRSIAQKRVMQKPENRARVSAMTKGKIWITNGINSKRINKKDSIPSGWHKGRAKIRKD